MWFALKRLLILFAVALAVYCLWPREPSLVRFDSVRMAELQIATWKQAATKDRLQLMISLYEIFERQYHVPPIPSLKMALDASQAIIIFAKARDAADQENALLPLKLVFSTLKDQTKAAFDPQILARMELDIWGLRADNAKRAQLTSALSDQLALLYTRPSVTCQPAAKKFALAMKYANERNWTKAQTSCGEGWNEIKSWRPNTPKSREM